MESKDTQGFPRKRRGAKQSKEGVGEKLDNLLGDLFETVGGGAGKWKGNVPIKERPFLYEYDPNHTLSDYIRKCRCERCLEVASAYFNTRNKFLRENPSRAVRHGGEYAYRKGCRCEECVEAVRETSRRYQERKKAGLTAIYLKRKLNKGESLDGEVTHADQLKIIEKIYQRESGK